MKKLTGETILQALSLPEWDNKVQIVLDFIEENRPKDIKSLGQVIINSKKYGVHLVFDTDVLTKKQKSIEGSGSLFLNHISFNNDTLISLPFDIRFQESDNSISEKINSKALPKAKYIVNETVRFLLEDQESEQFFMILIFEDENLQILKEMMLMSFGEDLDYSAYETYKVNL